MLKFPSIGQYSATVKTIRHLFTKFGEVDGEGKPQRVYEFPKVSYVGTVKLHGTNASIIQKNGKLSIQSRNRVIDVGDDNAGFAAFVRNEIGEAFWEKYFGIIRETFPFMKPTDTLGIYGEWCCGNIQKGVGLSQVPEKKFVVFAIRVHESDEETFWISPNLMKLLPAPGHERVRSIYEFPHYEIEIDFAKPGEVQNTLVEITKAVEKECPVALALGVSGTGEGVVWRPTDFDHSNNTDLWFKVKGEEHSVSKVKTLASVDIEKVNSIGGFVDQVLTEARLNQGIEYLREMKLDLSQKSTGEFLKWIVGDVIKEESDAMAASSLDSKEVNKQLSGRARMWFFQWLQEHHD